MKVLRIVLVVAAALLLVGGGAADAKKKKHKKVVPPAGLYSGATSNGIQMSLTLAKGAGSGTMTYCSLTAPLAITGRSFTVAYTDPISMDSIFASGFLNAKSRTASGTVQPNGCDASVQTFDLLNP